MKNKDRFYICAEVAEKGVDKGGFTGANFSGDGDKPFPLIDPVNHRGKCLPVAGGQIEELGVRCEIKRLL